MTTDAPKLIAFVGYARAGKDVIANHLIEQGFIRMNFGDFIKEFYDDFLQGRMDLEQLEVAISERLYTEKSETDLGYFLHVYAERYAESKHSISAFTEDNALKEIIRPILEHGGELIYGWVLDSYNRKLDEYVAQGRSVVNTRLCQLPEAATWTQRGGLIVHIVRKDHPPATQWDEDIITNLEKAGYLQLAVWNNTPTAEGWNEASKNAARMLVDNYREYQTDYGDYLLNYDRGKNEYLGLQ